MGMRGSWWMSYETRNSAQVLAASIQPEISVGALAVPSWYAMMIGLTSVHTGISGNNFGGCVDETGAETGLYCID